MDTQLTSLNSNNKTLHTREACGQKKKEFVVVTADQKKQHPRNEQVFYNLRSNINNNNNKQPKQVLLRQQHQQQQHQHQEQQLSSSRKPKPVPTTTRCEFVNDENDNDQDDDDEFIAYETSSGLIVSERKNSCRQNNRRNLRQQQQQNELNTNHILRGHQHHPLTKHREKSELDNFKVSNLIKIRNNKQQQEQHQATEEATPKVRNSTKTTPGDGTFLRTKQELSKKNFHQDDDDHHHQVDHYEQLHCQLKQQQQRINMVMATNEQSPQTLLSLSANNSLNSMIKMTNQQQHSFGCASSTSTTSSGFHSQSEGGSTSSSSGSGSACFTSSQQRTSGSSSGIIITSNNTHIASADTDKWLKYNTMDGRNKISDGSKNDFRLQMERNYETMNQNYDNSLRLSKSIKQAEDLCRLMMTKAKSMGNSEILEQSNCQQKQNQIPQQQQQQKLSQTTQKKTRNIKPKVRSDGGKKKNNNCQTSENSPTESINFSSLTDNSCSSNTNVKPTYINSSNNNSKNMININGWMSLDEIMKLEERENNEFAYSTLCRDEFSSFIAIKQNNNNQQQQRQPPMYQSQYQQPNQAIYATLTPSFQAEAAAAAHTKLNILSQQSTTTTTSRTRTTKTTRTTRTTPLPTKVARLDDAVIPTNKPSTPLSSLSSSIASTVSAHPYLSSIKRKAKNASPLNNNNINTINNNNNKNAFASIRRQAKSSITTMTGPMLVGVTDSAEAAIAGAQTASNQIPINNHDQFSCSGSDQGSSSSSSISGASGNDEQSNDSSLSIVICSNDDDDDADDDEEEDDEEEADAADDEQRAGEVEEECIRESRKLEQEKTFDKISCLSGVSTSAATDSSSLNHLSSSHSYGGDDDDDEQDDVLVNDETSGKIPVGSYLSPYEHHHYHADRYDEIVDKFAVLDQEWEQERLSIQESRHKNKDYNVVMNGDESSINSPMYPYQVGLLGQADTFTSMLDTYLARVETLLKLTKKSPSASLNREFVTIDEAFKDDDHDDGDEKLPRLQVSEENKTEMKFSPIIQRNPRQMSVIQEIEMIDESNSENNDANDNQLNHLLVETTLTESDFWSILWCPQTSCELDWTACSTNPQAYDDFSKSDSNDINELLVKKNNIAHLEESLLRIFSKIIRERDLLNDNYDDDYYYDQERNVKIRKQQEEYLVRTIRRHVSEYFDNYLIYLKELKARTAYKDCWRENFLFAYKRPNQDEEDSEENEIHASPNNKKVKTSNCTDQQQQQDDLLKYSTLMLTKQKPKKLAYQLFGVAAQNDDDGDEVKDKVKFHHHHPHLYANEEQEDDDEFMRQESSEHDYQRCPVESSKVDLCELLLRDIYTDEDDAVFFKNQENNKSKVVKITYKTSSLLLDNNNYNFSVYGYLFELSNIKLNHYLQHNHQQQQHNHQSSVAAKRLEIRLIELREKIMRKILDITTADNKNHYLSSCSNDNYDINSMLRPITTNGRIPDNDAQPRSQQHQNQKVKFLINIADVEPISNLPVIQFCAKITGSFPIRVRWFKWSNVSNNYQEISSHSNELIAWNSLAPLQLELGRDESIHQVEWPTEMHASYDYVYRTAWCSRYRFKRDQGAIMFEIKNPDLAEDYDQTYKCVIDNYSSSEECSFKLSKRMLERDTLNDVTETNNNERKIEAGRRAGGGVRELSDQKRDSKGLLLRTWSQRTLHKPVPQTTNLPNEVRSINDRDETVVRHPHHIAAGGGEKDPNIALIADDRHKSSYSSTSTALKLINSCSSLKGRYNDAVAKVEKFGRDFPYHPENLMKRLKENKLSIPFQNLQKLKQQQQQEHHHLELDTPFVVESNQQPQLQTISDSNESLTRTPLLKQATTSSIANSSSKLKPTENECALDTACDETKIRHTSQRVPLRDQEEEKGSSQMTIADDDEEEIEEEEEERKNEKCFWHSQTNPKVTTISQPNATSHMARPQQEQHQCHQQQPQTPPKPMVRSKAVNSSSAAENQQVSSRFSGQHDRTHKPPSQPLAELNNNNINKQQLLMAMKTSTVSNMQEVSATKQQPVIAAANWLSSCKQVDKQQQLETQETKLELQQQQHQKSLGCSETTSSETEPKLNVRLLISRFS